MQRAMHALAKKALVSSRRPPHHLRPSSSPVLVQPPCDIFINHRGIDTKKTSAGLLHYHLTGLGFRSFLDSKNMKPGDNLYDKIDAGIRSCKIGVAVFSPRYCESPFCLHELALLMETKKRVIPVFCDVKPSELRVSKNSNVCSSKSELERYEKALEEAKFTVGLTFDSLNGDWSEFLQTATDAVIENLIELEGEEILDNVNYRTYNIRSS